jgi:uncharacterized protein (TIRG00374 family)
MTGSAANPEIRSARAKRAIGYIFALACLFWVFHDIQPRQLLSAIHVTNWWFLVGAVLFDILTYVLQGLRWSLLLSPIGRLRTLKATQAIYVGLFTNEVVPLRFGELVRAFLASKWLKSGMGSVVPSMVVERFLDSLWLLAGIVLVAGLLPLPSNLVRAGEALGIVVAMATMLFIWLVVRKERKLQQGTLADSGQRMSKIAAAISNFAGEVASGLRQIGFSRKFYIAAAISGAMLACQGLAVWLIMWACGLSRGIVAGAVVMLVVRLGTAIPNAPANVGSFQFFTVLALGLFGVEKSAAAAFSLIAFAVLTTPLWIVGLFSLSNTGMSYSEIRAKITELRR